MDESLWQIRQQRLFTTRPEYPDVVIDIIDFDLLEKRTDNSTAIIRIEQYYPFPTQKLADELIKYSNAKTVVWAQEESANMGAKQFIIDYLIEARLLQ